MFSNSPFRFNPALPIRLYTTADDPGVGDASKSGDVSKGNDQNPTDTPDARKAAIQTAVRDTISDLLGKNGGDKDSTLETLVKRNYSLETQLENARKGGLSKEDRATFDGFKALGVSVEDAKRIIEEHSQWGTERAQSVKSEGLKKAAAAKKTSVDADLLASLGGALDVDYLTKGEGDEAEGFVKVKEGDKEIEKTLLSWINEKWPNLKDRLLRAPEGQQSKKVTRLGPTPPANSGGKAKTSFEERQEARREARKEKTNPLMKR